MTWIINFYSPHVEFEILKWPAGLKAKLLRIFDLIKEHGANLGMPLTRAIGNGLFEIRVKANEGIGRAFFCYFVKNEIIILHGFIKKTQQTPQKDIDIAFRRLQEVSNYEI